MIACGGLPLRRAFPAGSFRLRRAWCRRAVGGPGRLGRGGRSRARPRANHPLRPSCPRRRLLGEDGLHGGQAHPRLAGAPVPVHPGSPAAPSHRSASTTPGWEEKHRADVSRRQGPTRLVTGSGEPWQPHRRTSPPGDRCASGGVGPGGRRRRASRGRVAPQDQTRGSGTEVGVLSLPSGHPQRARGTPGHAPHPAITRPRAPQAYTRRRHSLHCRRKPAAGPCLRAEAPG